MTTVLITGASSGMGAEFARAMIRRGHTVYAAARRLEPMRELEREGARLIAMDVTDDEQMVAAIARIEKESGGVDVLINNAGYGQYGSVEETPLEEARRQIEVNVFGLARLTQLVIPGMRERRSGRIVNISSIGGKVATPFGAWYHASKHAIEGWSDALRLELAEFGIDVIVIQPGGIQTPWGDIALEHLRTTSAAGPYREFAGRTIATMERTYAAESLTPPAEVAAVVDRAVHARRPRTRYAVGHLSGLALNVKRYLGDRAFDAMVMRMTKA